MSLMHADAIVVLGAAVHHGMLSAPAEERVDAAAVAWHTKMAPIVVVSGAHEANAMALAAMHHGIDREAIVIENRAHSTYENALFTALLLGSGKRVLVVTQPYHRLRAVRAFRKAGLEAEPLAFASTWQVPFKEQMRELGAIVVYLVRGWI